MAEIQHAGVAQLLLLYDKSRGNEPTEVWEMPSFPCSMSNYISPKRRRDGFVSPTLWAVLIAFALSLLVSSGASRAAEAQANFSLKNGWVELALSKDGRPLANATIEIVDQHGAKFGDGETGEEGRTAFPLPPGVSFVVEIKAGDRTADPIRLFKNDTGVEPARVLLSYGLRPCCRSIKSSSVGTFAESAELPRANEDGPPWHNLVPPLAGVSIVAIALFMIYRR